MSGTSMITSLGRYEILGELGQGAMGLVYKGRDPLLDRIVAIKTINLSLPKQELAEYEARFYQEAKAAGGLSHRNIVTIYDIGRSERVAYMAMEYLEGQELRQMLQAPTPIPLAHALEIGAQVADGLQYAHERLIIHRDIKPANIIILKDLVAKITDFGIARMRNNEVKTATGIILGSPRYMSPEQVSGKRADNRSDIFALGVVLYEMFTGSSPFVADDIHGVMYQTMSFNPPAPRTLNPELPDILNYVIAKALAKKPDERYQQVADLANDLREAAKALVGEVAKIVVTATEAAISNPIEILSRHEDKEARILEAAQRSDSMPVAPAIARPDQTEPHLNLSKAFDSFNATMRLAALVGEEKNLDRFNEGQKKDRNAQTEENLGSQTDKPSASSTWQKLPSLGPRPPSPPESSQLRLIWIGSAVLVLGAAALLLVL
ncbi:MAG: serine/threonine-protein kinase [Burkholderiales bacterium]